MSNPYKIGVFSSICEADACWIDQYLAEVERLDLPFAIHLDRCSSSTKNRLSKHRLCIGTSFQEDKDREFVESDKQAPFDNLVRNGLHWALAWDVDETWEKDAPSKIDDLCITLADAIYIDTNWVNLWEDSRHIRVDGPFGSGHRVKFYNLQGYKWKFTHKIINGPKLLGPDGNPIGGHHPKERKWRHDLTCLHWGLITVKLRQEHKDRWDRIYTAAVGANPYGMWNFALDGSQVPEVKEHNYL